MQKIQIKIIVVLFIYFVGTTLVKSQTLSTVQIKDLVFFPEDNINQVDTSKIQYRVNFKISDAANTEKVYLLFGTAKDSGNVLNSQANIIHVGGVDSISYNNQSNVVSRYTVYIPIQFLKSLYASMGFLTVYVEDNFGKLSNKLYYSINP